MPMKMPITHKRPQRLLVEKYAGAKLMYRLMDITDQNLLIVLSLEWHILDLYEETS